MISAKIEMLSIIWDELFYRDELKFLNDAQLSYIAGAVFRELSKDKRAKDMLHVDEDDDIGDLIGAHIDLITNLYDKVKNDSVLCDLDTANQGKAVAAIYRELNKDKRNEKLNGDE